MDLLMFLHRCFIHQGVRRLNAPQKENVVGDPTYILFYYITLSCIFGGGHTDLCQVLLAHSALCQDFQCECPDPAVVPTGYVRTWARK